MKKTPPETAAFFDNRRDDLADSVNDRVNHAEALGRRGGRCRQRRLRRGRGRETTEVFHQLRADRIFSSLETRQQGAELHRASPERISGPF